MLEHLIGRDLAHFLPDPVLQHSFTTFLPHFVRARVLVGSMLALTRSKGKFGAYSFACRITCSLSVASSKCGIRFAARSLHKPSRPRFSHYARSVQHAAAVAH